MLQERDARHPRADVDTQGRPSPGTAAWDVTDAPAVSSGRFDTQVNFTSGEVDSATTLQNPNVSERTIGSLDSVNATWDVVAQGRLR